MRGFEWTGKATGAISKMIDARQSNHASEEPRRFAVRDLTPWFSFFNRSFKQTQPAWMDY